MKKEKVNELFFEYHNLVPENRVTNLKSALERADDEKEEDLLFVKTYNPVIVLILSIFFGAFGVDRFYLKDTIMGVCKLLFLPFNFIISICYYFNIQQTIKNIALGNDVSSNLIITKILLSLLIITSIAWAIWSTLDIYFSYKKCKEKNFDNILYSLGFRLKNYNYR